MKDVTELTVSQVRIFPSDCLPFTYLALESNAKVVKDALQFDRFQTSAVPIIFENGSFEQGGRTVLVSSLTVEPRRTILKVLGNSEEASAAHALFENALRRFDPRGSDSSYDRIVLTEETSCVATLDVSYDELFSSSLSRFLGTVARERLTTEYASPTQIGLKRLSFEVRYEPSDASIRDHDVMISQKLITIEPRAGTPLKERRFFSSTPADSSTHLALLEALEQQLRPAG